jgi:uncharacterized flavoprotein (TIGR03862 family)
MKKVVIIGGGPAGLFSAYLLLEKGFKVELYDHSSGLGKKFLVAGNGGLNLTHSEELSGFSLKYEPHDKLFSELINEFTPEDLRRFCTDLGVETFIGSSGRVFPKKLKAAEILLAWNQKLKEHKHYSQFLNHHFNSLLEPHQVEFILDNKPLIIEADFFVFAMGGASWSKTGSTGEWAPDFVKNNIGLAPFLPMNCGFERSWSEFFKEKIDYTALKNISLEFNGVKVRGEAMLTSFGIEGGGVYALSKSIRDEILKKGSAVLTIDLKPDLSEDEIAKKIEQQPSKASLSNCVRKALGFEAEVFILLKELHPNLKKEEVPRIVKKLNISLCGIRPLDEAISTSGGVLFNEVTEFFELKNRAGSYAVGEMLDFDAPTGGYLIQGCFSTAARAVKGISLHT